MTDRTQLMTGSGSPRERDLRIDFFRGIALIFIFIDHVPANRLADFTLRNFGFADAAEVFVLLAGYSAVLAYGRALQRDSIAAGLKRVGRRVWQIYAWHVLMVLLCALALVATAAIFRDPKYVEQVGLSLFAESPARAVLETLALLNQPNTMNILPLYVVIMAWFPVTFLLIRKSPALALGVSMGIWALANATGINLPSRLLEGGWYFNPFAWQLLLTIGAVSATCGPSSAITGRRALLWIAVAYVLFAMLVAAPWTRIPAFADLIVIRPDAIGHVDKTYLSPWRLAHVIALGYIALALIPKQAAWLKSSWSESIARCGRHSLQVYCLGTLLSLLGWVILAEAGSGFESQLLVNTVGIGLLVLAAWGLSLRKERRFAISKVPHDSAHPASPWPVVATQ